MGNLCSKKANNDVEMKYNNAVRNPVAQQSAPPAAKPASPKPTRKPPPPEEARTPPKHASPVARPKSAEVAAPVNASSPKTAPKSPAGSKSPPSPNKKKLSDLLHNEKAKQGKRQGQPLPGIEGWLHRESDTGGESVKVWATLYEHRLDYYKEKPSKGNDLVLGYLTVKSAAECEAYEKETTGFFSTGNHCFKLNDGTVEVSFSAPSEDDRAVWVNSIIDAIDGVRHTRPDGAAALDPSECRQTISKRISAAREGMQAIIELPRKVGELSKKPIVGRFGLKSPKTRWFKLEGGELRYYGESSMRPSSLKQTLPLVGCTLNAEETKIRTIVINLTDGNQLCMEATSKEIAMEWTKVLGETMDILNTKSAAGKTRRINVANEHSDGSEEAPKKILPKSDATKELIQEALSQHFLMSSLGDSSPVVDALQPQEALPGDVIIWQGTPGELFYVLETGLVEVVKEYKQVGQISDGRAFGELALLNSTNRAATIRALSPCKLWTLDRKTFRNVLANGELQKKSRVVGLLRQVKLFEKLSESTLGTVADVVQRVEYASGERIIKQGEAGDAFYVIESGSVSVTQSSLTSSAVELVRLSSGAGFGELALISNEPRKASVSAVDAVVCLRLDVATFNSLLGNIEQIRNEDAAMAILKKVELLKSLTDKQLAVIARGVHKQVFPVSSTIFSQGDVGENFYMIASGEVVIQVNHVEVAKLKSGDYFGETSLMSSEKRNATAIAAGGGSADSLNPTSSADDETVCLLISRDDFNNLLGPLEAIMKAESDKRAEEASNKGLAGLAKSFSKSLKRLSGDLEAVQTAQSDAPLQLNDLIYIRTLGTGTFGVVKLAYHPGKNMGYALKIMEKQTVVELHQEKGVYFERDLMKELDYPLLPQLFATFNDTHNLYMLLELLPGGEFWGILHEDVTLIGHTRLGGIDDSKAAFYSACVLAGLGHMHSMDICYRDMKPENMVLDSSGYIKIVDYGFCKKLPNNSTTNTMCGTPEYIPPEMVRSRPHTRAVDLWSFGVFLYELATRGTPFEHNETSGIYRNIVAAPEKLKTAFKSNFPPDAKTIILKLLVENPAMRIGMGRNGFDDIWEMPYYTAHGITKEIIESKSAAPPFRPEVPEVRVEDANNDDDEEQVLYAGKIDFSNF